MKKLLLLLTLILTPSMIDARPSILCLIGNEWHVIQETEWGQWDIEFWFDTWRTNLFDGQSRTWGLDFIPNQDRTRASMLISNIDERRVINGVTYEPNQQVMHFTDWEFIGQSEAYEQRWARAIRLLGLEDKTLEWIYFTDAYGQRNGRYMNAYREVYEQSCVD